MRAFFAEGAITTNDGEKLALVCDFFTIDVVEQIAGENWDKVIEQLSDPPRALVIKLLYGLLRKRHESITLDEAAGVYHDCDRATLGLVIGDIIRRACNIAGDDPKAKDENPPKRRGRSRTSEKNG